MNIHEMPVATAEMLIRKPIATVFDAFVDPAITSKFWFTKGSGRLEAGKRVRWDWDMYGVSVEVVVKALEVNTAYSSNGRVTTHRPPWNGGSLLDLITRRSSASKTRGLAVRGMRCCTKRLLRRRDL